jgi:hypothetical protein
MFFLGVMTGTGIWVCSYEPKHEIGVRDQVRVM